MKPLITAIIVITVLGGIGAAVYFASGDGDASAQAASNQLTPGADGQATASAIVVSDDRGRQFTFDRPPQRIAALSSFAVEILMALDTKPVARFEDPDLYPASAEGVPVVGKSHSTGPDVEQLIASHPDLVILHEVYGGFADSVEQATGARVMVMNIKTLDQVREKLELFGKLVGREDQAGALIDDLGRTRAWLDEHRPAGDRPVALSLLGMEDAWYAHRDNHFMGSLMAAAGAENVAGGDPAHSRYRSLAPIDLEQVIAKQPEVIFLIPYGDANAEAVIAQFNNHPATQSLAAVRSGRVHVLPDTIYTSQPGPRSGQALRELYGYLFPGREASGR